MPESKKMNTAIQVALITSVIGPVLLLIFQFILKPSTVNQAKNETKREISTITISDSLIREKYNDSVVLVKNTKNAISTGFLLYPSFILTTTNILKNEVSDSILIIRDINKPSGPFKKKYRISVIDTINKIALINTDTEFLKENTLELKSLNVERWDKIFAIGFTAWEELSVVREGRIITNDYELENGITKIFMGDIGIVPGMTGSPVFNKDGILIGMIRDAHIQWEIAYIVPIRKIQYLIEEIGR